MYVFVLWVLYSMFNCIAANPFVGTTVGVAVCLLIAAFLMAVATGKAKRHYRGRQANTTPSECLRHHLSSSTTGLPGPQV